MDNWEKLKQKILLYKEYLILVVFGIGLFSWIHIAMGLDKEQKPKVTLIEKKVEKTSIKIPSHSIFLTYYKDLDSKPTYYKQNINLVKSNTTKNDIMLK